MQDQLGRNWHELVTKRSEYKNQTAEVLSSLTFLYSLFRWNKAIAWLIIDDGRDHAADKIFLEVQTRNGDGRRLFRFSRIFFNLPSINNIIFLNWQNNVVFSNFVPWERIKTIHQSLAALLKLLLNRSMMVRTRSQRKMISKQHWMRLDQGLVRPSSSSFRNDNYIGLDMSISQESQNTFGWERLIQRCKTNRRSMSEGETSYHNLDFRSARTMFRWQSVLQMIRRSQRRSQT